MELGINLGVSNQKAAHNKQNIAFGDYKSISHGLQEVTNLIGSSAFQKKYSTRNFGLKGEFRGAEEIFEERFVDLIMNGIHKKIADSLYGLYKKINYHKFYNAYEKYTNKLFDKADRNGFGEIKLNTVEDVQKHFPH